MTTERTARAARDRTSCTHCTNLNTAKHSFNSSPLRIPHKSQNPRPPRRIGVMWAKPSPRKGAATSAAGAGLRHDVARRMPNLERDRLVERAGIRQCRIGVRPVTTWRSR